MSENNALKLLESLLDDRINLELENEINNKKSKPLPNFILDQLSMKFGLKTLAVKNVVSMKMGIMKKLKNVRTKKQSSDGTTVPYTQFLLQLIGIDDKEGSELPVDQIDLVVKARAVFMEAVENYKRVMSIKPKKFQEKMKNISTLTLEVSDQYLRSSKLLLLE